MSPEVVVRIDGLHKTFGNLEVVRNNLTAVILGIIVLSVMPAIIEFWRARRAS